MTETQTTEVAQPKPQIWKSIPDYPHHEAGSLGSIRRVNDGKGLASAGHIHKQRVRPTGYATVSISGHKHFVHRLVCAAFHGAARDGQQVSHENGDKSDNRPCNLRWRSAASNNRLKRVHGTHLEGSACAAAKVTEAAVMAMRSAYRMRMGTHKEIADVFGLTRSTVGEIINRKTWRHVE